VRFIWFLAYRHLRYRKTQSLAAVLGVAVGMAVLLTSLSLFNGFTQGLLEATLRATPHLMLLSNFPDRTVDPPPAHPQVLAQTPFLIAQSLLSRRAELGRGGAVGFASLVGLGEQADLVFPQLDLGGLAPGQIVLGESLARSLGAWPGDSLLVLSINQKRISLQVASTFTTGNEQIDAAYGFTTLSDTRQLLEQPQALTGYQLRLRDPLQAVQVGQQLAGQNFYPRPWQDLNQILLQQLALQKQVAGIVVFLIVVVAVLGIANVLVLAVVEKTAEIAVLRVIGARATQVAGVFALEGVLLGLAGVVLGNLLGWGLSAWLAWRPLSIPGDLYFLTQLGARPQPSDFVWVSITALAVVLLASLLPLWRALQIRPGLVLR
jgi:lipoprotein-releasing system permease protein